MAKRRRKAAVAAGLAATPLLLLQQPAAAAESMDVERGEIVFQTIEGFQATCNALVEATHDTDDPDRPLLSWSTESTVGSECTGLFRIVATYRDANGTTRSVRYNTGDNTSGGVDGAYSPTSVTLEIYFTQCDSEVNETCTLSLTASPK